MDIRTNMLKWLSSFPSNILNEVYDNGDKLVDPAWKIRSSMRDTYRDTTELLLDDYIGDFFDERFNGDIDK